MATYKRILLPLFFTLASVTALSAQAKTHMSLKETQTCFWRGPYDQNASLYPDKNAHYWSANFTIPAGKRVFLQAEYPRSRYLAYASYTTNGFENDDLRDESIQPDNGSTNPYIAGNSRNLTARSYKVELVSGDIPAEKTSNTIYSGRNDSEMIVWYRIYATDKDADLLGNVAFPELIVQSEDGSTISGQEACDSLSASQDMFVGPAPSDQQYAELLASAPPKNPGQWQDDRLRLYKHLLDYGLFTNPDNKYVELTLSQDLGSVMVLRGKLPTAPTTWNGDPTMTSGNMRYWSMCSFEFYTQQYTDCLFDEQVTVDAENNYVIAISHDVDRPDNAIASCGFNWIEWSSAGDGHNRPQDGMILLRNMEPDPSFTQAIQDVKNLLIPEEFVNVMGPYLPTAEYMTKSEFEALGCNP